MTALLSLDPGGTTGLALFEYDENSYELVWRKQVPNGLQGFLDWTWEEGEDLLIDEIVCENFSLREGLHGVDLSPCYVIGALEALWPNAVTPITYQAPSQKSLCGDARLDKLRLHVPGKPHANDAVRHAIIYLRNKKHKAVLKDGWAD